MASLVLMSYVLLALTMTMVHVTWIRSVSEVLRSLTVHLYQALVVAVVVVVYSHLPILTCLLLTRSTHIQLVRRVLAGCKHIFVIGNPKLETSAFRNKQQFT